jgi:Spy/CpxP family protein refolding chaperone
VLNKTIVALTAAVALGCVPVATAALAASQPNGHANGGGAMCGDYGLISS